MCFSNMFVAKDRWPSQSSNRWNDFLFERCRFEMASEPEILLLIGISEIACRLIVPKRVESLQFRLSEVVNL